MGHGISEKVVPDCLGKQSGQTVKSSPVSRGQTSLLPQFLPPGSCLQLLPSVIKCYLKVVHRNKFFPVCFWSWCSTTARDTIAKTEGNVWFCQEKGAKFSSPWIYFLGEKAGTLTSNLKSFVILDLCTFVVQPLLFQILPGPLFPMPGKYILRNQHENK